MKKIIIMICLVTLSSYGSCYAKGYMALKHDLGYEAEHQRPENYMGQTTSTSDRRNYSQNYGLTTNTETMYNTIQNAQGYAPLSTASYLANQNGSLQNGSLIIHEPINNGDTSIIHNSEPQTNAFARDIEEQTKYVVDRPYKNQY